MTIAQPAHPSTVRIEATVPVCRHIRQARIRAAKASRPCACIDGLVFVGYEDDNGVERFASYRCRLCGQPRSGTPCTHQLRETHRGLSNRLETTYYAEEQNMTETSWVDEEYRASDLWCVEKSITPLSDEEQLRKWEQAVAVLDSLGKLAETLHNDPLILALTDALERAEEEQARLKDRLSRPEGEELHSREHHRLKGLLHSADDSASALTALEREEWRANNDSKEEYLEHLAHQHREACEAFERYREEVGISR